MGWKRDIKLNDSRRHHCKEMGSQRKDARGLPRDVELIFLKNRNLKQEDVKRSLRAKLKAWNTFRTRTSQEDDWDCAQRRNLIRCSSVSRKRERNLPVITECKLCTKMRE